MKRLLACGLFAFMFMLNQGEVSACTSIGDYSFLHDLEYSEYLDDFEYIVRAQVLEADDSGYSAILEVDSYFRGSSGNYLAVMRFPPSLQTGRALRGYTTSCLYSGSGIRLKTGDEAYFGLSSNGDGSYRDIVFPIENNEVTFFGYELGQIKIVSISTDEFEERLLELEDAHPAEAPSIESRYPLKRFLYLTTEAGQRYRLNPDYSASLRDDSFAIAVSPDGSHVAYRHDEESLSFFYIYERALRNTESYMPPILQEGQHLEFSPDSNLVAVWEADKLGIYLFDNYEYAGYGQAMNMNLIAEYAFAAGADAFELVWSPDSSTIAFRDAVGIWKWNLYYESQPVLVEIPQITGFNNEAQSIPKLIDLSRSGMYLRYGESDNWMLLNILTGESYVNAVATPDESNLIFFGTEYPEDVYDVRNRECRIPLSESCPIYIRIVPGDFFWYEHEQIAVLTCYPEESCVLISFSWNLAVGYVDTRNSLWVPLPYTTQLVFDPVYSTPAYIVGDYGLRFDFYREAEQGAEVIDLSSQLDSPIAHIEWGQPIFYEER